MIARAHRVRPCWVYFAQHRYLAVMKIGCSAYPDDRVKALVFNGLKYQFDLLGTIEGDELKERKIHRMLDHAKITGISGREWFNSNQIRATVRKLLAEHLSKSKPKRRKSA